MIRNLSRFHFCIRSNFFFCLSSSLIAFSLRHSLFCLSVILLLSFFLFFLSALRFCPGSFWSFSRFVFLLYLDFHSSFLFLFFFVHLTSNLNSIIFYLVFFYSGLEKNMTLVCVFIMYYSFIATKT